MKIPRHIFREYDIRGVADRDLSDAIAEGMLAAVKRLYLLGKNDRPTGTFTFAELLAHELSVELRRACLNVPASV